MTKQRREFRRFNDLKGLNDAPEPFFRARSDFEGPGARKPPKSTNKCKTNVTISKKYQTNVKNTKIYVTKYQTNCKIIPASDPKQVGIWELHRANARANGATRHNKLRLLHSKNR